MLTQKQLLTLHHKGCMDEVARELRTYGTIELDDRWQEPEGHYKGSNRLMFITHHGFKWELFMLNGEVREVGQRGLA